MDTIDILTGDAASLDAGRANLESEAASLTLKVLEEYDRLFGEEFSGELQLMRGARDVPAVWDGMYATFIGEVVSVSYDRGSLEPVSAEFAVRGGGDPVTVTWGHLICDRAALAASMAESLGILYRERGLDKD